MTNFVVINRVEQIDNFTKIVYTTDKYNRLQKFYFYKNTKNWDLINNNTKNIFAVIDYNILYNFVVIRFTLIDGEVKYTREVEYSYRLGKYYQIKKFHFPPFPMRERW